MPRNAVVVALAGKTGVGKDTVASMFSYIYRAGKSKATYYDWLKSYTVNNDMNKKIIIHFADNMKLALATILGVDKDRFDDRKFKDEYYYIIPEMEFVHKDDVDPVKYIFDHPKANPFKGFRLSREVGITIYRNRAISVRRLMRWFANNFIKESIHNDIWAITCLNKAKEIGYNGGLCIIADLRFPNELSFLRQAKGIHFHAYEVVSDELGKDNPDNLDFEQHFLETSGQIRNNNKTNTFYQVMAIMQDLRKQHPWL